MDAMQDASPSNGSNRAGVSAALPRCMLHAACWHCVAIGLSILHTGEPCCGVDGLMAVLSGLSGAAALLYFQSRRLLYVHTIPEHTQLALVCEPTYDGVGVGVEVRRSRIHNSICMLKCAPLEILQGS
jgi:hypothetical protein